MKRFPRFGISRYDRNAYEMAKDKATACGFLTGSYENNRRWKLFMAFDFPRNEVERALDIVRAL